MSAPAEGKPAARIPRRRWAPIRFVRARPWLAISAVVFVAAGIALVASGVKPASALLLSFDLGALLYLGMLMRLFNRTNAEHMCRQAHAQDSGRRSTLWIAVALSTVVLVALSTELHAAKSGGAQAMGMAALSIVLSWLFMNTMYALHYAHGYYGDFGKQHEGLEFPGTKQPDYWDFVYFAFVIGMCFQVSDVQITSHTLRRTALLHSVVAFFFNVFIIAISVNIAAGLA
ncbi:DUF1345 domain-containing protein [Dyella psychrodurans]|uniref:DUF1345 domain-containing protein n=1 Tax=Dyella psychrodurans TaxID=1927960 RepID=A0A370WW11_9GAMM|nr:DUF1345 domain-containing protein [Dyella psychrodurans]RDS80323.1 DUF1345 domain-containing protein [Dyella psychrodurans]